MKHIKRITLAIFFTILSSGAIAADNSCPIQESLSEKQWIKVEEAFQAGKNDNLGYTMAAITLVESKAGIHKINKVSESYGITQININTAIKRMNMKDTPENRKKVSKKLINSDPLSFKLAREELLYWKKVRHNNWRNIVSSYNAGWKLANGRNYLHKVIANVRKLEACNLS